MKAKPFLVCIIAASLAAPVLVIASEPDADSSGPGQFVKDSAITAG